MINPFGMEIGWRPEQLTPEAANRLRKELLGLGENEKQYEVYLEGGMLRYIVASAVVDADGVTEFYRGDRLVARFGRILGWKEGDL